MANGGGCCMWYWDGTNWHGPQSMGCIAGCDPQPPANPPPQPGMVCVPCLPPPLEKGRAEENSQCCAAFPIPDGHYLFFPAGSPSLQPCIRPESAKSKVRPKKKAKK
jgi:hypothetical protein